MNAVVKTTVILANGEFPSGEYPRALLENAERIICCDGAAASLLEYGIEPDVIIGDLDSLGDAIRKKYSDRTIHISEQESNDLAKAFRFCVEKGYRGVVVLGATGKREDHTIANVSLLADFASLAPVMVTDQGIFRVLDGEGCLQCESGQQISIFSQFPEAEITSSGLKYPLVSMKLPRWHTASLNEAEGTSFTLKTSPHVPLIVFLAGGDRKR